MELIFHAAIDETYMHKERGACFFSRGRVYDLLMLIHLPAIL